MKNEELRAVMDDLSSVTREQQVVNSELVQAAQERDEARGELRSAASRIAHLEQLLRAKDKEREDLLKVYQELGVEARRLSSTVAQLERDAGMRETQVSALKQENDSLQVSKDTHLSMLAVSPYPISCHPSNLHKHLHSWMV